MIRPETLRFTPGNWDRPQTVTITGVDDDLDQTTVGEREREHEELKIPTLPAHAKR